MSIHKNNIVKLFFSEILVTNLINDPQLNQNEIIGIT